MEEYLRQIEAILFGSGKLVTPSKISKILNLEEKIVREHLLELQEYYDSLAGAILIENIGNKWRMNLKAKYVDLVSSFIKDLELPDSLLETISVILYKYPITQAELVKIRSNKAYDHLDKLEDMDFIKKEKKGNTYIIKVTKKLKEYFDFQNENDFKEVVNNSNTETDE